MLSILIAYLCSFGNFNEGNGGRREEPKPTSSGLSNLAVVPSLTLIDNSHCPPRIFDRGDLLGTGGFAKVYKVTERATGDKCADKVINKETDPSLRKQMG